MCLGLEANMGILGGLRDIRATLYRTGIQVFLFDSVISS